MDRPVATRLKIGAWKVDGYSCQISKDGQVASLEARTMRLLLCLADHAGEVVSIQELLDTVWSGVIVTPDSVYQAVASLRRQLGDDAKDPLYVETVPRLGYRMVASVSREEESTLPSIASAPAVPRLATAAGAPLKGRRKAVAIGAAVCVTLLLAVGLVAAFGKFHMGRLPGPQVRSVAVMPFLDLTSQKMDEEYFSDGMTEELIDKLSKIPGIRVPSPTSSFYFKGKQMRVADIAKALGVDYVLDGSVRQAGSILRIAVRLVRADDGFVVWSQTYDRPLDDKVAIQDEIAGEVAKQLRASIT
jgi:transcriptional activator of cad operon